MTKKLLVLVLVLALCLIVLFPIVAGDSDINEPVITTTEPTEEPTPYITAPTEEPTEIPTVTAPTEEPTEWPTVTQSTEEPTEIPTVTAPTEEPTGLPTVTEPTELPTVTQPTTMVGGDTGYVDVYCNADGATVYFNGNVKGTIAGGLLSVPVSTTGTPVSTITVTKSGYTSWSGSLANMPEKDEHVAVYATINPVAPTPTPPLMTGAIYAQSSPYGAAIYLNGNFQGYSPLTLPNLVPGTYTMRATMGGFTPDSTVITVNVGQTSGYYPSLSPSPQPHETGTVYVTSNPSHALVYVDGDNYYGKTPLTLTLYPGSHQVELSLAGYNDYTTYVGVTGGQSQDLPVTLSTGIYGTVTFASVPGATVYMDSNAMGTVDSAGSLVLSSVPSGKHLFKVTAPGYYDWLNTIYVQAGIVTAIPATLTSSGGNPGPVQPTGSLAVSTVPQNAEVWVDGLFRGFTPLTVDTMVPGQHSVRISSDGYLDYTTTTTVISGQTAPVAATLTVAPTPTPTSSPAPGPVPVIGVLAAVFGSGIFMRRRS
ncbi:MAG: PEGA domain-containing protein [Methanoregula sp.]